MALALHAAVRNKLGRQSGLRATVERRGRDGGFSDLQKYFLDKDGISEYGFLCVADLKA
jgi:hypothetical protein